MSAQQCSPTPNAMNEQHLCQPEVLLPTGPQQAIFQVPLMLCWPTTIINPTCTPVTLNPQMTLSFSVNPNQPVTIPCLFSNVIVQPTTIPGLPLLPAQVLVSNVSAQDPGTANQAPVICAQSNNMASRVPENYAQTPVASNQGSSSAEEDRQKVMDAAEALLILHNSSQAPQVLKESEE